MGCSWRFRLISGLLTLVLLFELLPIGTFASDEDLKVPEIQPAVVDENGCPIPADPQTQEAAPIMVLGEDPSLRSEHTKQFRLSDGSSIAATYEIPVHYQDADGLWQEIDNRLVYQTAEDGAAMEGYATADNPMQCIFAPALSEDTNLVEVQSGKYAVSFRYLGGTGDAEPDASTTEASAPVSILQGEVLNGPLKAKDIGAGESGNTQWATDLPDSQEIIWAELEAAGDPLTEQLRAQHAVASVGYGNVQPGVSLQYITYGTTMKEYILVNQLADFYEYTFSVEIAEMWADNYNNGLIFYDKESGEPVFEMPALYMTDAAGAYSQDVYFSLNPMGDDLYELVITADQDWINAPERVLPIQIDPTLIRDLSSDHIRTGYVCDQEADITRWEYGDQYLGYDGSGEGGYQTFVQFRNLPNLPANSVICGATLSYFVPEVSADGRRELYVNAYKIDDYTEWGQNFWQCYDHYRDAAILDYVKFTESSANTFATWNITDLVKQHYESGNQDVTAFTMFAEDQESLSGGNCMKVTLRNRRDRPIMQIAYRDTRGLESYYTYQTQEIGRAGAGYVSDYTGQLTLARTDLSYASTVMSFSLAHVYNSAFWDRQFSGTADLHTKTFNQMKSGNGWKLSIQETVVSTNVNNTPYLVYTDEDGTEHYFYKDGNIYRDEDGLNLKISVSGSTYTLTDEKDNQKIFVNGFLTSICDANGNKIHIVYNGQTYSASGSAWKPGNQNNNQATSVVLVPAGSSTATKLATLAYSNGFLSSITDFAGRVTTYSYANYSSSSAQLTKVTRPDGTFSQYGYSGTHGRILHAYDSETQTGIRYTYQSVPTGYVVSQMEAYYASGTYNQPSSFLGRVSRKGIDGRRTVYVDAGDDLNLSTSADNLTTTLVFDSAGRTVNADTKNADGQLLGVTAAAYSNKSASSVPNRLLKSIAGGQLGVNLLQNGSMETGANGADTDAGNFATSWVYHNSGGKVRRRSGIGRTGNWALRYYINAADASGGRAETRQKVTLQAGTSYTFSIYAKTTALSNRTAGGGVMARLLDSAGATMARSRVLTEVTATGVGGGWERLMVTFTPASTGTYYVAMGLYNAAGTVVFDDAQLETGDTASSYNLVADGSFELNDGSWVIRSNARRSTWSKQNGNVSVTIQGASNQEYAAARQTIPVNCSSDATFLLSGWARADSAPGLSTDKFWGDVRYFGLVATVNYTDGTREDHCLPFNESIRDWQYASMAVVPRKSGKTVSTIVIFCCYYHNVNQVCFDSIALTKEPAQTYTYDKDGKLQAVNQTDSDGVSYTYDGADLIKLESSSFGTYNISYNSAHQAETIQNNLVKQSMVYTGQGQTASVTLTAANGSGRKLQTSAGYNAAGLTSQVTDSAGGVTRYGYTSTRQVDRITDPAGTVIEHRYNQDNDRIRMSYLSGQVSLDYAYENGNLTGLTRGGYWNGAKYSMQYDLDYDALGRNTAVSVGGSPLARYQYVENTGKVDTMTYGNRASVTYTYDLLDRMAGETWSSGDRIRYAYDGNGQVERILSEKYGIQTDTRYEYDGLGRLIRSSQYRDGSLVLRTFQQYDGSSRLRSESWQLPGATYVSSYSYDKNGRLIRLEPGIGPDLTYGYDSLNRLKSKTGEYYVQSYVYRDLAGNKTTSQVEKLEVKQNQNGSPFTPAYSLSYTYDAMGNIATVKGSDVMSRQSASYEYDAQGQLVGEENTDGTTHYSYDGYGNLRKKVSQGGGLAKETYTLNYGTTGWVDRLQSVKIQRMDGSTEQGSFSYDGVGNPLKYYNGQSWNLSWENGRELAAAASEGVELSFAYGASGARNQKIVRTEEGAPKPTEPTDPTDPVEPPEPTKPVEPTKPTHPTLKPTDPTWLPPTFPQEVPKESITATEGTINIWGPPDAEIPGPIPVPTLPSIVNPGGPSTRSVSQGSTVIHNYTYASGKLLQKTMASGAAVETLDFSYDESGAPYHLRYTNGAGSTWSYQYLCNLQGDVIGLLNSTGDLVARYVYDAWGRPISITDGKGKDVSGDPSHIANRNPLRYRGYYYDRETGFYYLQSRYYDPVLCRFINADDYASTGQGFLGHNMFAYCNNSPCSYQDPDGTLQNYNTAILDGGYGGGSGGIDIISLGIIAGVPVAISAVVSIVSDTYQALDGYSEEAYEVRQQLVEQYAKEIVQQYSPTEWLPDIAGKYGQFKCKDAAKAMENALIANDLHGAVITISYPTYPGYVFSTSKGICVSQNGTHVGIEYNGIVYCNVHPYGLPLDIWINDFDGVGKKQVLFVPF